MTGRKKECSVPNYFDKTNYFGTIAGSIGKDEDSRDAAVRSGSEALPRREEGQDFHFYCPAEEVAGGFAATNRKDRRPE